MKRADLDTDTLLRAVARHGPGAWSALVTAYPPKVVLAAIERDVRAGYLNYGVSATSPWIEQAGADRLRAEPWPNG